MNALMIDEPRGDPRAGSAEEHTEQVDGSEAGEGQVFVANDYHVKVV